MIEISARRPLRLSGSLRNGHFSLVTQETYADRNETAQRSSYRTRVMFCVYNSSFLAGSVRNQFLILSIPKAQLKNKITCFLTPNSLPFLSQYLSLSSKSYWGSKWLSCKAEFFSLLWVSLLFPWLPSLSIHYQNLKVSIFFFHLSLFGDLIKTMVNFLPGNIWKAKSSSGTYSVILEFIINIYLVLISVPGRASKILRTS